MSFPLSVSNITATHATLTWTYPSEGEGSPDNFKIYRNGSLVHTNALDDHDWGDDGLSPATAYAFQVKLCDGDTVLASTSTVNIVTPSPPAAPSLLTAQAVDVDQINLDWQDNSSNELDFHIEVSDDGSTGWAEISPATVAANVVHKEVTGLASDALKYFRVRSHNASGYSGYSNVAYARTFAAVAQPTNLAVSVYSGVAVDFSFQDNSTAEDDHRLEMKIGAGAYSEIQTVSANVQGGRVTGLTAGLTYTFKIRAKAGAAYSDYSNEVTVTTLSVPGAPSAIVISEVQDTTVRLTWTAPATGGAVVGYKIESSPDDSTWTERAKIYTQVCSYKPISLTPSQLVYFRIRAFNAAGDGSYCASASETTLAAYAPSVFEKWLRNPVGRSVVLIEAHPKMTLQGWTLYGAAYTYQVTINIARVPVDEVLENGVALAEAESIAAVETTAGSWYFHFWNRILYVHTSDGSTPTNFHMEAGVWIYITNQ